MRLIRAATLSIGVVFAFASVALGQRGNWFEPIGSSPKPIFHAYNTPPAQLKSGKPSGLRAQSETPKAKNTMAESLDAWNARFEARETESSESAVPESQPMLQPGILQAPEQASVKPWSIAKISTHTLRVDPKRWISVGPGSLPLAITIQPDATEKYGADPATLQVYFGHRR
jgi:hypothetical protein